MPRILISTLVLGLAGGLLGALILGPVTAIGETRANVPLMFAGGLTFGLGVGIGVGVAYGRGGPEPKRIRTWGAIRLWSVVTAALGYCVVVVVAGLAAGLAATFATKSYNSGWIALTLAYGFVVGLTFVVKRDVGRLGERGHSPQGSFKSRGNSRMLRVVVLLAAAVVGVLVVTGITTVLELVVMGLIGVAVIYGLARLAARLAGRLIVGLAESANNTQDPRKSWHNDRVFRLVVGLVSGLAVGLPIGVLFGWGALDASYGLVTRAILGLSTMVAYGLVVGLVYGLGSSVTWSTTLAWLQLQWSGYVPAVGLMPFLEDARSRDVLRADGPVYQFRHATLQDHLAAQATAVPQPLRHRVAAERPSERGKPRPAGRDRARPEGPRAVSRSRPDAPAEVLAD